MVASCWRYGQVRLGINFTDLTAPLVLRNVYIADVSTSFPIVKYDKDIVIDGPASLPLYFRVGRIREVTPEIEKEMRNGLKPEWLRNRNLTRSTGGNLKKATPYL